MFVAINALKVVPLKLLILRAETPTARYLDMMVNKGPSNSIFCTSLSTALRALIMSIQKQEAQMRRLKNFQTGHTRRPFIETEDTDIFERFRQYSVLKNMMLCSQIICSAENVILNHI